MNFLRVSLTLLALKLQMQFVFSSNDNNISSFGSEEGDMVIDREQIVSLCHCDYGCCNFYYDYTSTIVDLRMYHEDYV